MHTRRMRMRAVVTAAALVALAVTAGCGSDSSGDGSSSGTAGEGITAASAQVEQALANLPLEVSPLPSRPDESTYAIQVNCTLPACGPGLMDPAMDALGWKFDQMPFDIAKGPSALQAALTQAIAAKPDVIIVLGIFPLSTFQADVDAAVKDGIKFVAVGADGDLPSNYSACIQCSPSAEGLGALAADIVLDDAGGRTDIAVAFDKTQAPLVSEADGLKEEIEKNGEGSKVLDLEQSVTATAAQNAARQVSFLQRNPDVKYLVLTNPQFQAAAALNSAGLGSRVKIVGMYPLSEADVASVKDGQVLAYAVGELASLYWRAADAAARATMDVEIDPAVPVQSLRVMNKSNADISLLDPADYENAYKTAWQVQ